MAGDEDFKGPGQPEHWDPNEATLAHAEDALRTVVNAVRSLDDPVARGRLIDGLEQALVDAKRRPYALREGFEELVDF